MKSCYASLHYYTEWNIPWPRTSFFYLFLIHLIFWIEIISILPWLFMTDPAVPQTEALSWPPIQILIYLFNWIRYNSSYLYDLHEGLHLTSKKPKIDYLMAYTNALDERLGWISDSFTLLLPNSGMNRTDWKGADRKILDPQQKFHFKFHVLGHGFRNPGTN